MSRHAEKENSELRWKIKQLTEDNEVLWKRLSKFNMIEMNNPYHESVMYYTVENQRLNGILYAKDARIDNQLKTIEEKNQIIKKLQAELKAKNVKQLNLLGE